MSLMVFALKGARVFDGEQFLDDMAVIVEGEFVRDVLPNKAVSANIHCTELAGGLLAPGFIDVQVNGGDGVILNNTASLESVQQIARAHQKHGTTGFLPTVITDAPHIRRAAIVAVKQARRLGVPGVLGIHIEGPFIDTARKGAHDARYIRPITAADIAELSALDCGAVMVTVAPNRVTSDQISQLSQAGVLVSLGHSDATFAEARAALNAGARSFTHLFNAMSQLGNREPGMVGAALDDTSSFLGVIADGHHVHHTVLKLAFASTSMDRFMLISDAMTSAQTGPNSFDLQGRSVTRKSSQLVLDDGTLAGSCLNMEQAVQNCVNTLGVPLATALQMASRNPARFLRRNDLGVIAPGAFANLVHLSETLSVRQTWINGQSPS
jgi:N-acetylglucosamine-6-phosphate deacetylase